MAANVMQICEGTTKRCLLRWGWAFANVLLAAGTGKLVTTLIKIQ